VATATPLGVYLNSGSRPKFPINIALFNPFAIPAPFIHEFALINQAINISMIFNRRVVERAKDRHFMFAVDLPSPFEKLRAMAWHGGRQS
jgi:hypothetical protein